MQRGFWYIHPVKYVSIFPWNLFPSSSLSHMAAYQRCLYSTQIFPSPHRACILSFLLCCIAISDHASHCIDVDWTGPYLSQNSPRRSTRWLHYWRYCLEVRIAVHFYYIWQQRGVDFRNFCVANFTCHDLCVDHFNRFYRFPKAFAAQWRNAPNYGGPSACSKEWWRRVFLVGVLLIRNCFFRHDVGKGVTLLMLSCHQ